MCWGGSSTQRSCLCSFFRSYRRSLTLPKSVDRRPRCYTLLSYIFRLFCSRKCFTSAFSEHLHRCSAKCFYLQLWPTLFCHHTCAPGCLHCSPHRFSLQPAEGDAVFPYCLWNFCPLIALKGCCFLLTLVSRHQTSSQGKERKLWAKGRVAVRCPNDPFINNQQEKLQILWKDTEEAKENKDILFKLQLSRTKALQLCSCAQDTVKRWTEVCNSFPSAAHLKRFLRNKSAV